MGPALGKGSVLDHFPAKKNIAVTNQGSQGLTVIPSPRDQEKLLPAANVCAICTQVFREGIIIAVAT
eukprot:5709846-Lingulodinium_polyedra.AAC.1